MERVMLSPEGNIALPLAALEKLGIVQGTELLVDVRGSEIVLAKEPVWMKMRGIATEIDMEQFSTFRQTKREHEEEGS